MTTAHMFDGGPPKRLERLIGLSWQKEATDGNRIFFLVLVGWIPLLDLALVQSALGEPGLWSFVQDFGVHARMLVAVPLLVLANSFCAARLSAIANRFISTGLINPDDRERFAAIRASVSALRDARFAEFGIVFLAIAFTVLLAVFLSVDNQPAWHGSSSHYLFGRSLAGWWHLLVSVPLVLVLVLSWLWRVGLWACFLAATARLDLRLIAAHPDGAGGLGFVGYSAQAFSVVALAFSVIVAGTLANQIMHGGASLKEVGYAAGVVVVAMVVIFCAPLCAFSWRLLKTWRAGVFAYGGLARDAGAHFEAKWLSVEQRRRADMLDAPDFSAVTDLYSIVANVYRMRMVPIALPSVAGLAIAAAVPFLPVALLAVPFDQVLRSIANLLM